MRNQLQALVKEWEGERAKLVNGAYLANGKYYDDVALIRAGVLGTCTKDLKALLAAPDAPGTLRLTCGCVSHLCEQHQKEMTNAPVRESE